MPGREGASGKELAQELQKRISGAGRGGTRVGRKHGARRALGARGRASTLGRTVPGAAAVCAPAGLSALKDPCLLPCFCCAFFPFLMKRSSFLIELIMLIEFPPSLCLRV